MFKRDTSFTPDLTPALLDAAHRNARRERSKAFHDLSGTIGNAVKGFWRRDHNVHVSLDSGTSAKPC